MHPFVEGFLPEGIGEMERIDQAVDWVKLSRLVNVIHCHRRAGLSPAMMVKVMLLQQWYGAANGGGVVGPAVVSAVPGDGRRPISRFRTSLTERGLGEELLEELNRQLTGRA